MIELGCLEKLSVDERVLEKIRKSSKEEDEILFFIETPEYDDLWRLHLNFDVRTAPTPKLMAMNVLDKCWPVFAAESKKILER